MTLNEDNKSIKEIVNDYITEYLKNDKSMNQTSRMVDRIVRNDPEKAWEIILSLIETAPDDEFLVDIGVGALEDLLAHHSERFIDRIEVEVQKNIKFVETLEYVWRRRNMSEQIWQRIRNALQGQWKDDIVVMQKLFRANNFDLGEEESIIGPKTKDAIEQLRLRTGLFLESIEDIIEELRKKEQ